MIVVSAVIIIGLSGDALAQGSPSTPTHYGEWRLTVAPERGHIQGELRTSARDLASHLGAAGAEVAPWVDAHSEQIRSYLHDHTDVRTSAGRCALVASDVSAMHDARSLVWRTTYRCEAPIEDLVLVNSVMALSRYGIAHLGEVLTPDGASHRHVFDVTAPRWKVALALPPTEATKEPPRSHGGASAATIAAILICLLIAPLSYFWFRERA